MGINATDIAAKYCGWWGWMQKAGLVLPAAPVVYSVFVVSWSDMMDLIREDFMFSNKVSSLCVDSLICLRLVVSFLSWLPVIICVYYLLFHPL